MTAKSARHEYFKALAAFDRACIAFSKGMGAVLDSSEQEAASEPQPLVANLGPRKPAKRAERSDSREQVKRAR